MSEGSTDLKSIKSEDIAALYSNIMTAPSASVIYKILMPALKVLNALWFEGKNITDFLKTFNNMCDNYSIGSVKQLKKVCCYCKRHICEYSCSLIDFIKRIIKRASRSFWWRSIKERMLISRDRCKYI